MEKKKKRYGIFHIKDTSNTVAWFEAESFDIMAGTALLAFKDEFGQVLCVHHLEPGYYVTTV